MSRIRTSRALRACTVRGICLRATVAAREDSAMNVQWVGASPREGWLAAICANSGQCGADRPVAYEKNVAVNTRCLDKLQPAR